MKTPWWFRIAGTQNRRIPSKTNPKRQRDTKTRRSHPRCRLCCQRPPNTKTGTGRRSQPTRTASSGGGFLRPNICLQLGGGWTWRCARFAIGTVEKIANARGSTSAFLAKISFFVFKWSLMGGEDNVRLSIPTPTSDQDHGPRPTEYCVY